MLITLIPLFDENLKVSAYSLFSQRKNHLLNPSFLGTGSNDGAGTIPGLEVINDMGLGILTTGQMVFIPVDHISIFTDILSQCNVKPDRLILLLDKSISSEDNYMNRIQELKNMGFQFAMRKVAIADFGTYEKVIKLMDYLFLDHKKLDIKKAKSVFCKTFPNLKLIAGNIGDRNVFEELKTDGGYQFFEGEFYRVPINEGQHEVSPLKANYIQLLNSANAAEFDLTKAADVIGRDTALVISLLQMVNRLVIHSNITSIRHAAAMLGQKELKKWISTTVANELYADKPNEITRLSLIRAKFSENLAPVFDIATLTSELFLTGLFSVLDVILERPMAEALDMVKVPQNVSDALIHRSGELASVYEFVLHYEMANWSEVSRIMLLKNISIDRTYQAYLGALKWYREVVLGD
jgi:EAL and modified HD-GYP domain-containing signal transduction protein